MLDMLSSWVKSLRRAGTRTIALIGLFVLCLTATGIFLAIDFQAPPRAPHEAAPPPRTTTPPVATPSGLMLMAALIKTTNAYLSPGGPAAPSVAPTWYGAPLYLPVVAVRTSYLEVRLPTRPNGSTTWIKRAAVLLSYSPYRIVIDLGTSHLLLYRNNKLVLDAPAGIGTVTDPTPTGHFFVAFFAKAPSPAWGPFVIVTSAHSDAISDWEESGDAVVAIHGPLGENAAIGSTGARVSHGCVRLHDADLVQLRGVPDGSPVDIISSAGVLPEVPQHSS